MSPLRFTLVIIGLLSCLFSSMWLTLAVIVALSILYPSWEAMALGLLMDMLWTPGDVTIVHIPLFTLIAIILVWAFHPIRKEFLH